jgi:preprotein translocase subunit SecB
MNTGQNIDKQEQKPSALSPFQLIDIRLWEITVERWDPNQEAPEELPLSILLHTGDEPPDAEEFGLLLTFETVFLSDGSPECTIFLAIEGRFRAVVDMGTIKPEVIEQFKSADAVVLFWPYLRQTLHDITNRMRLGVPPLPIIDPRALVQHLSTSDETEENNE